MQPTPGSPAVRALGARVVPQFQPIVDLATREVLGYEALARWPDVPGATPDAVFDAAAAAGTLLDLDWICRRAAVEGALDGGLRRPLTLFVNVEPRALGPMPRWRLPEERFREIAASELQIVVEFTERELLADPAAVMAAIDWAREFGCGIALDDVGVNPDSLTLLPLVLPDVVKLDRGVVVDPTHPRNAAVVDFVIDYAVNTGARIVAEGIETERDAQLATVAGATLGQGYLFGAPAPLGPVAPDPVRPLRLFDPLRDPIGRPSEILDRLPSRVAEYGTIARVFDELSVLGDARPGAGCLLVSAQNAEAFVRRFGSRYAAFARKHTLVGVIGAGRLDIPGVRGPADTDDAFPGEFAMVIMTPMYTQAVVARDLGDRGPLENRRYAWCLTHDRAAVRDVGQCIVRRLAPREVPVAMVRAGPITIAGSVVDGARDPAADGDRVPGDGTAPR
ncbi:EAL domain-containing protein [Williamsia deligens]|uniref:EAL domain-containing protein n=1 Tax=Williamsia deligens TaxID=321325 RepID=A0ABW3G2P4_9NOCA|nr:EAL domain-containing protein [Williamsia deligens]MCP2194454.1 EAL domain, c-di-GMP-specific phosphodiesterase class I (or its enzymatically inactive variant) [Williamsia deligens]